MLATLLFVASCFFFLFFLPSSITLHSLHQCALVVTPVSSVDVVSFILFRGLGERVGGGGGAL